MKTSHVLSTPNVAAAAHTPVSYLRSDVPLAAVNTTPLRLLQALGQLEELRRALASSQQAGAAAMQQVALLTEANARLRELAARREHKGANVRHLAVHDELAGLANRTLLLDPLSSCTPTDDQQRPAWKPTDCCLAAGLDPDARPHMERLLAQRIRFRKGQVLYRIGDAFHALYAIRTGSCKTVLLAQDGQDQIAGYHMAGEIIGTDGIGTEFHECQAAALEDLEVCPLPFDQVESLARLSDPFRHNLHKLLSQESVRAQTLMIVLGSMRAEQRLAVFLLDLSQRYRARGYSSCEFTLRMTREEIGSYLGLKLETVSRLFSRFQREGLIQVQGRAVKLLDRLAVSRIVDCGG